MHPLDMLANLFGGGQQQQPGSAAPPQKKGMMDWLNEFHNMLASNSGGFLQQIPGYTNDASKGPAGYNMLDIAKQAQMIADQQKKKK